MPTTALKDFFTQAAGLAKNSYEGGRSAGCSAWKGQPLVESCSTLLPWRALRHGQRRSKGKKFVYATSKLESPWLLPLPRCSTISIGGSGSSNRCCLCVVYYHTHVEGGFYKHTMADEAQFFSSTTSTYIQHKS